MPRVNLEQDCWSRIAKLAGLMGCTDREAAGTLGFLWHDSQDILRINGTCEEIVDWAHLYGLSADEIDRWISGMIKARFLTDSGDGTYLIHGNEVQIDNRVNSLKKSQKGGEATRRKWEVIKAKANAEGGQAGRATSLADASLRQATATPQQGSIQAIPIQATARQDQVTEAAIPSNYKALADRLDPSKQNLIENAAKVIIETIGSKTLSPRLRRDLPEMLRAVNWDPAEFAELCSRLKVQFDEREAHGDDTPISYREVALKREFGLIQDARVS